MPKVVMVKFPDSNVPPAECPYHSDMTDEQNVAEWTQGWGEGADQIIPEKVWIEER